VALGHECDAVKVRAALGAIPQTSARLRVRLLLHHDGGVDVTAQPLAPVTEGTIWRAALADFRLDSADPLLAHKTTRRQFYDDERMRLAAICGADEAIFLNEKNELCEGSITTIFLDRDGVLVTPPRDRGLLPGVLRKHLIDQGKAREGDVRLDDLRSGFYLGNSVRGLIPARLAERA